MLLPNKLFSYKESTLAKFPVLIKCLSNRPYSLQELHNTNKNSFLDIADYAETLCCLYALRRIELDELFGRSWNINE
ncbi:ABC-three component system middle component 7 [Streptococcus uberis]|uniref:ABC-three component system middle component 7 n=1 Tax=Streptococcus uberis TaxID=1349 RepID=UPI00398EAD4A